MQSTSIFSNPTTVSEIVSEIVRLCGYPVRAHDATKTPPPLPCTPTLPLDEPFVVAAMAGKEAVLELHVRLQKRGEIVDGSQGEVCTAQVHKVVPLVLEQILNAARVHLHMQRAKRNGEWGV